MSIKPLPDDVIARIKSSTVITSINAVACGLLQNSLDAKASKVNIVVDYRRGNCSVEDDGCGIGPAEFLVSDGGIGKLYYTSKHPYQPAVHGRHGTFLASVAALSLLTITSRHEKHNSYNHLSIHNSKDISRHIPALPEQRLLSLSHGTRVTVRDLFGSMPVRVKQRALETEASGHSKDWDQFIRHVLALLLACDREVVVSVKDNATNDSMTLRATDSLASRRSSRYDKSLNLIPRSTRLLSQASLCDLNDIESWVSVGVSAPRYSINGCVSLIPVATKRTQFISLGIQPIQNDYYSNVLYEEINKVFANSSFGVVEDGDDPETGDRSAMANGFAGRDLKAKKGIDRWPMFYLRIIPDLSQSTFEDVDDVLDDGRHGLPVLIDLIKAVFHELLRKHHFRPHAVRLGLDDNVGRPRSPRVLLSTEKSSRTSSPSVGGAEFRRPSKQRKLDHLHTPARDRRESTSAASSPRKTRLERLRGRSDSPFAAWSRVKSASLGVGLSACGKIGADHLGTNDKQEKQPPSVATQGIPVKPQASPLIAKDGQLLRKPFGHSGLRDNPQQRTVSAQPEDQPAEVHDTFVWENPRSKIKSIIDSRTGFVVTPRPTPPPVDPPNGERAERGHRRTCIHANPSSEPSAWTKELLSSWKNPVFEAVEAAIPRLPDVTDVSKADGNPTPTTCNGCHSINVPSADELRTVNFESRISRDNLSHSEVIAQVDKKFILFKVPVTSDAGTKTSHLLVLIDQHAADERCRVESMMADYFTQNRDDTAGNQWTARAVILERPLHFDFSQQERKLLERFQQHFQHWGVFCEIAPSGNRRDVDSATQVIIHRLPPSIAERCQLEPKLLADLIRKEIWTLEEAGGVVPPRSTGAVPKDEPLAWVARFHGCPQGILEMINSRACRSAIMFNDVLSIQECKDLVARLLRCAFPFQCAHGRPSMVPIIDLGRT